jgi:hypothetical protein
MNNGRQPLTVLFGIGVINVALSAAFGRVDVVAFVLFGMCAVIVARLWIGARTSRERAPLLRVTSPSAADGDESSRGPSAEHMTASIHIDRPAGGYANRLRQFKIVIDGEAVGGLSPGEARTFDVPAGSHTVCAKIDWCRSRKLTLELSERDKAHLVCGNPPLASVLAIVWITLGCRRFPQLAVMAGSQQPQAAKRR